MGVYKVHGKIRLRGYECAKVVFRVPTFGGFGAWMTFKKAEMAKTLRNGLSMLETNLLNHKWLDFVI